MVYFFFQAEDGIRDLVRSRGLGDVYKRQARDSAAGAHGGSHQARQRARAPSPGVYHRSSPWAVSYTHLTLPTSDLV